MNRITRITKASIFPIRGLRGWRNMCLAICCFPASMWGQPASSLPTYNDPARRAVRTLQYVPQGDDFVSVNGKNRYTRALYGGHTAFRLETSDRPVFAVYEKGKSKNVRFRLYLKEGGSVALDSTAWCEARYTAGRRSYRLTHPAWGDRAELQLSALALPNEDAAVWKITPVGMPEGAFLRCYLSEIKQPRLSRNGDMGADPPGCFDAPEHPKQLQTLDVYLSPVVTKTTIGKKDAAVTHKAAGKKDAPMVVGADGRAADATYLLVRDYALQIPALTAGKAAYDKAEQARQTLASRIKITTPDPYFNTLGGALAVAADGIWDGQVWLHGAIGWRMPLNGWRAAYTGDALGWHDRARTHFDAYAASQLTEVPNTIPHPAQDPALALARSEKRWGTPQYSNGYICRNPQRKDQMHHYDMNLCYIDELLWHLNWTGDLDYARRMWPALTLHLAWEKRNYDPDDDGLYDAYACIWASDALYYNSGAVTHSSAYNYRANRMAAVIASKIGEDPTPYQQEANKTLKALNSRLWMAEKGHWAEYQDFMGHRRLHPSAGVWTIYHALDSDIGDPFQAYEATTYIDREIPHIPIIVATSEDSAAAALSHKPGSAAALSLEHSAAALSPEDSSSSAAALLNAEGYATISTTNWLPYSWSINNVAFAEVMHTALAYFQAGRADAGFKLLKSSILDGMYLGDSPGNFGQVSFYDAARGECYRDFGDPVGVASRVLIQGLYGILPDALNGRLLVRPGLPAAWGTASLATPDILFDYNRQTAGAIASATIATTTASATAASATTAELISAETYTVLHRLPAVNTVELQFPARRSEVARLTVNGRPVQWWQVRHSVGRPMLAVEVPAASGEESVIRIEWAGQELSAAVVKSAVSAIAGTRFKEMKLGQLEWFEPAIEMSLPTATQPTVLTATQPTIPAGTQPAVSAAFTQVLKSKCQPVAMENLFNASVTDIFRNEYLSPRSPYTTLQLPKQGIGEWCHPLTTAEIDDAGVRTAVSRGILNTNLGVPFRTPAKGKNIVFTSLWDNYPDSVSIPLKGKASRAYLLLAGSTNHMQCHIANGVIRVYYTDGSSDILELVNPDNWCPIEQDFFVDEIAFRLSAPRPYRLHLKSGLVSNNLEKELDIKGVYGRSIDGGAGVLLDMPLNPAKKLSHLTLETLSNDVVIGLMGITLQR